MCAAYFPLNSWLSFQQPCRLLRLSLRVASSDFISPLVGTLHLLSRPFLYHFQDTVSYF